MRGFVVGLSGFTAFFFVLSAGLQGWGIAPAFLAAVCAALAAVFSVSRLVTR
jgi:hypothetical protein